MKTERSVGSINNSGNKSIDLMKKLSNFLEK